MNKPLVRNAADPRQVKAAAEKEKFGREQELADMRQILGSAAGRRFLWRVLEQCSVHKTSYDPSGSRVYFNEGMRNVGLWTLGEITEADPGAYISMMQDAALRKEKEKQENTKEKDTDTNA